MLGIQRITMDLLKFITAGSVDDGKSTLIGRLLYDTDSVLDDQLEAIQRANRKNDDGTVDLAILTDGLKAEREQGITIDVAYKYFQTPRRKFIIADTPGHIEYTRNMVTGASNADLAIILIDARKGVVEQTKRHSFLVSLLAIPNILVCINKMDMVDYDEASFEKIKADYLQFSRKLSVRQLDFIPVSALRGDNIVNQSVAMAWYKGPSLLDFLETVDVRLAEGQEPTRLPIQWVIRPQTEQYHDYRGYTGRIASGALAVGDPVVVLPSGQQSTVRALEVAGTPSSIAEKGASVTVHLADDVDISRGDLIATTGAQPELSKEFVADVCWMDKRSLDLSQVYLLQHHSRVVKVKASEIVSKINIHTLEESEDASFGLNDIGKIRFRAADYLPLDRYQDNKANGGAILIDSRNNLTVGALMISSVE